jgi:O-antigen ligase
VDAPIIALLIAFTVSFYNIESTWNLVRALENFAQILAGFAMFYLVVNNLQRPEHLERVHVFQCVSIATVCLLGVFELTSPSGVFIPGWIGFRHSISEGVNIHNVRIGGPFFDFELLSEYCAINLLLLLLLVIRARSGARRMIFGSLFALTFFIMFATVTRGGIMAFAVGLLYLLWVLRRRLRFVPVAVALAAAAAVFLAMNYYVANFTNSGDLIARLSNPDSWQFKDGMPAARAPIWQSAFERMMIHPWFGHGPVYNTAKGLDFWYWPHNGYLYIGNLVGIVGLTCYLWLLFQLWRASRPVSLDLRDANYARAYLLIAHVQLVVFAVDQLKIDFLRNPTYPFQVWLLFAYIVSAHRLSQGSKAVPAPSRTRA